MNKDEEKWALDTLRVLLDRAANLAKPNMQPLVEATKREHRERVKAIKAEYVPEHKRDIERVLTDNLTLFGLSTATVEPVRAIYTIPLCQRGEIWAARQERKRNEETK